MTCALVARPQNHEKYQVWIKGGCWSSNTSLLHSLLRGLTWFSWIAMISYGLDLGELIQQYIWLFWPVHTYNNALVVQPSPCAPSLMDWGTTSLIWGIEVWPSVPVVYFSYFGSPRSIYCHLEPPTHLYLHTHDFLGLINDPTHFTNVHTLVHDCLGWIGVLLVHLGGIQVKSNHETCTTPIGF